MKHRIRDLIVFLFDQLGVSFLYRIYCRTKRPLVRVLCFHDVTNAQWFEDIIKMLVDECHIVTPEQFHARQFVDEKINILLTFDDGYQSWVDVCLPVLNSYNLKALFFINSGLLDIASNPHKIEVFMKEHLHITPKKPLSWDGARKIADLGHSIGGHTRTHANVRMLSYAEAMQEISLDKKRHEEMLGIVLTDFAYPFGTKQHFKLESLTIAKQAGYTWQYSAIPGFVGRVQTAPISRTLIEKDQSIHKIRSWIFGGYDMFYSLKP